MLSLERIESTIEATERIAERYPTTAVLMSFGKDSMVLWHLLRHFHLPVVVCLPPCATPAQWAHAERVIKLWSLDVHVMHPVGVALSEGGGELGLVSSYQTAFNTLMQWRQRVPDGGTLCGLKALRIQPEPAPLPFSLLLCGQKHGDPDFAGGKAVRLDDLTVPPSGPSFLLPLRTWSDDDVWDYAIRHNLPLDPARYDISARKEHAVTAASNDRADICLRCVDRRNTAAEVLCPAVGANIPRRDTPQFYLPV